MSALPTDELRKPFPPDVVGKLPRVTCGACRDVKRGACEKHKFGKCNVCGNWITTGHIHLDYVGHAEVTDRLLSVDPEWTWEPFAITAEGLPCVTKNAAGQAVMWIHLTVAGITRPGVGIVPANKPELEKELISDALRNASMRFGVALDLWAKEGLESALESDNEQRGEPNTGAEDDGDQSGTAGGDGKGSSQPALTPGFSGDRF